jgi:hypothetical protein
MSPAKDNLRELDIRFVQHMFLCILEMVNAVLNRRGSAAPRRVRAASLVFEGIKREDLRVRPEGARRLGAALAERGEIAYWVVTADGEPGRNRGGEKRASSREQTRLRSAKLLDAAYRFLCECRICDCSLHGLRLALGRNIRLPRRMAVHIDETGEVRGAKVVWRRGSVIGVHLRERAPANALKPWDRFALRERYYGILD